MKVCLILTYYGKLPKYFPLYIQSLRRMNFFVLLFTDIEGVDSCENLTVVRMSLVDIESLARTKLGVKVRLAHPRRLCDMKPMYGKIFEDYLLDSDYWGFGDCDLIYGIALRGIVEQCVKNGYDVISLRRFWTTGSFCLVKNDDKGRMLYSRANNWKYVACLTKDVFVDFDETGGKWHQQLESGRITINDCYKHADSFTAVVWRSADLRVYHQDCIWETNLKHDVAVVHFDGRLTVNGTEKPIVHFVNCKGRRYFVVPKLPRLLPNSYRITDTGFYYNNIAWAFRWIIAPWRKCSAIFMSLVVNGPSQLFKRIF